MRGDAARALGTEQAQAGDRFASRKLAGAAEPQQTERQQPVVGRRILSRGGAEHGPRARIRAQDSPRVIAGERMFEVRGGCERGKLVVGKLPGEQIAEARAELLAKDAT